VIYLVSVAKLVSINISQGFEPGLAQVFIQSEAFIEVYSEFERSASNI